MVFHRWPIVKKQKVMRKRKNEALLRKFITEILNESAVSDLNKLFVMSIQRVKEIVSLVKGELEQVKKDLSAKIVVLQHLLEQIRANSMNEMPEADDAADLLEVFVTNLDEMLRKLQSRPSFFGKEKYQKEIEALKGSLGSVAQDYFGAIKAYHTTTLV
jgi:hypothetical protein